jgi:hypothetical protein
MQLTPDITPEATPVTPIRTPPWWVLLCIAGGSFLTYRLFAQHGKPQLAMPIMAAITAHCYAIALRWDARRRASMWVVVVVSLGLHAALILSVPWTTNRLPARAIVPFLVIDLLVILAMIRIVAPTRGMQGAAE